MCLYLDMHALFYLAISLLIFLWNRLKAFKTDILKHLLLRELTHFKLLTFWEKDRE